MLLQPSELNSRLHGSSISMFQQLESSWAQLRSYRGALGSHFAMLARLLGSTWSLLGASWAQLRASWLPLGLNLEPLARLFDSTWALLGRFWVSLGFAWAPSVSKWPSSGLQVASKWPPSALQVPPSALQGFRTLHPGVLQRVWVCITDVPCETVRCGLILRC